MKNNNFVRMNVDDNHLSLGNIFRVIKEESANENFVQADLFSAVFSIEDIADSTVNNYCTGKRAINQIYRKRYIDLREEMKENIFAMKPEVVTILSILDNDFYPNKIDIRIVNNSPKLSIVCERLYNISKNDSSVTIEFTDKLRDYLENGNLYSFMAETLLFAVLEKKQPVFLEEEGASMIQKQLYDTNISAKDINDFMNIQLNSGIWSIRGVMNLAKKGNPFACYEMASYEFNGIITGTPRYDRAYKYYKIAADQKHANANWAVGYMYLKGLVGNATKHDKYLALKYINKARHLKSSNAFNTIGTLYRSGEMPHIKKNKELAKKYFEIASEMNNVYGINNLGKIYEDEKDYDNAFKCFKKSADLGESWAANRVGEYYRKGTIGTRDMKKAFEYFQISTESPLFTLCDWSKYNLAKYFYIPGNVEIGINKDISKAISLYKDVEDTRIEAVEELIFIYYKMFIDSGETDQDAYEMVKEYSYKLETMDGYNEKVKDHVEQTLTKIYMG